LGKNLKKAGLGHSARINIIGKKNEGKRKTKERTKRGSQSEKKHTLTRDFDTVRSAVSGILG
jgi:hypothetical protein